MPAWAKIKTTQTLRRDLHLLLGLFVVSQYALHALEQRANSDALILPIQVNIIGALACFVMLQRVWKSSPHPMHMAWIAGLLATSVVCAFTGIRATVGFVFTGLGLLWLLQPGRAAAKDLNLAAAGVVALALAVNVLWARLFMMAVLPVVLAIDAFFMGNALSLMGIQHTLVGTTFHITNSDVTLSLIGACSSFWNISVGFLAGVALIIDVRPNLYWRDLWLFLGIVTFMIGTNALRLAAMAPSYEAYEYWHHGTGSTMVQIIITVFALGATALWVYVGPGRAKSAMVSA